MGFEKLLLTLTNLARQRVRSGQISERSLARICGISQPHIHNVLKDIRSLSPASADRLMRALGLSVSEILIGQTADAESAAVAVPLARHRIGPGSPADLQILKGASLLEKQFVEGLVNPVLARLSPDLVMPAILRHDDCVLLDQNEAIRQKPSETGLWVVAKKSGLRVRYIKYRQGEPCSVSEVTLGDPRAWRPLAAQGRNILDVVRARIVWISRKMETEPAGPARGTRESD